MPGTAPDSSGSGSRKGPQEQETLEQELHSIYGDEVVEDMTRLEKARNPFIRKMLVGLIVFFAFLAAVSWAGFFLFSSSERKFSGEGVELSIEGPKEIMSGVPVSYTIFYRNGESIALGTADLDVRLPKEFIVSGTEPGSEERSWHIGSIGPRKRGEITISGVYLAQLDKELDLQAILTYRPADFNSEFQKVDTETVRITGSAMSAETVGPPKVLPGDSVTLDVTYRNSSENEFKDVVVRMEYPDVFIPDSSDLPSTDGSFTEWLIPEVAAQSEGHIMITGTFASEAQGRIAIAATTGFLDTEEEFRLQSRSEFETDVLEGDLVTSLILNGKNQDQTVSFGDMLRYAVSYRNTGSVGLEDVEITMVFETQPDDARMLLWNELDDPNNGVRDGNRITWTMKQIEDLEYIAGDGEGTVSVEIPVLTEPLDLAEVDYKVTAWVETKIGLIDGEKTDRVTKTQPVQARLNSDTTVTAAARYFDSDGIPVGTGPLPPIAGQQTAYRATWHITNDFHEISDLRISAKLPPNTSWTGNSSVDAGDLRFDAAAEKMIWTLNWMPTTITTLDISFDLAFTPAEEQVGKTPTLMDATIMEAIDKVTGSPVILSVPPVTTALESDDFANGKGKVQR